MNPAPPVPSALRDKGSFEFLEALRRIAVDLGNGYVLSGRSVVSSATAITLGLGDEVIVITGTIAQTVNLPSYTNGKRYIIKNRSTQNVTLTPSGTQTIDGVNASSTIVPNASLTVICIGSDWVTT